MRLLVVPEQPYPSSPLKLVEVFGKNVPDYAILSHTWDRDEVLYADVQNGTAPDRLAYDKLRGAMAQARSDDHRYLWVDTCCIDKSSSVELQEAINSMFAWYRRAKVCYVYLADVHGMPASRPQGRYPEIEKEWDTAFETHFTASRWFPRGWTLQELIAPRLTKFFSSGWHPLGKVGISFSPGLGFLVASRTGIDARLLRQRRTLSSIDIGTRLSWVTNRETSRQEDMAYCMLGICDVNMPLLYGEGIKAFSRLQEEIMRKSSDHTLFTWTSPVQPYNRVILSELASDHAPSHEPDHDWDTTLMKSGLLSPSPDVIATTFWRYQHSEAGRPAVTSASPYQMTNEGLEMRLPLRRINDHVYLAELRTGYGVYLHRVTFEGNVYVRIMCDRLPRLTAYDSTDAPTELIYIAERPRIWETISLDAEMISQVSLRPSADTAARFQPLQVTSEVSGRRIRARFMYDWSDMPVFRIDSARVFPLVHRLVLKDSEDALLVVVITNLPHWTFPMLGAHSLRFSADHNFRSAVQLEPAGVDVRLDNYTVSTAHASSWDGEHRVHDLCLIIERTRRSDTCDTDSGSNSSEGPDVLADNPAHCRLAKTFEGEEEDDYLSRIDALSCDFALQ